MNSKSRMVERAARARAGHRGPRGRIVTASLVAAALALLNWCGVGSAESPASNPLGSLGATVIGATPPMTLSATANGLWIGDASGGLRTGGVANALGMLSSDTDLSGFTGVKGLRLHGSVAGILGRSVTENFVGDALVVSNLDAYQSLRLYEAWIEKNLIGDRLGIRAGVLGADGEFSTTDGGGLFTNSAFGWCAGIGANIVNGGPVYFVPGLGARVTAAPVRGWTLLAGVWDGDSFDSPDGDPLVNKHGMHFNLDASQGGFWIAEVQRAWNGAEDSPGAPGGLKLGGWQHTADFPDLRLDTNGLPVATSGEAPAMHACNRGVYGSIEQTFWRSGWSEGGRASAWVRGAVAPSDRSPLSRVIDGGFNWTGPWRGRPDDAVGIAIVDAAVSPAVLHAALDVLAAGGDPGPLPDGERVLEFAYRWKAGQRVSVTPGLQWVRHPGASAAIPNALVPQLRLTVE